LLLRRYESRCCLSGIADLSKASTSILRASHIKSWAHSDQSEKLDLNSGRLLAPHYDLLFDKGLISFNRKGGIIRSDSISGKIITTWALDKLQLPYLADEIESYMSFYRKNHGF
jgi:predicted restriction endonuclease